MYLVKLAFAFASVGGASYTLFSAKEIPRWLKAVVLAMSLVAIITVLPELPRAVQGVELAAARIASWFERRPSVGPLGSGGTPLAISPRCVAIAMSARGAWGMIAGDCNTVADEARAECRSASGDACASLSSGRRWVAGVACQARSGASTATNAFPAVGDSEEQAFGNAFAAAAISGFAPDVCRRKVSATPEHRQAVRY